jgi:hypothetical protein
MKSEVVVCKDKDKGKDLMVDQVLLAQEYPPG